MEGKRQASSLLQIRMDDRLRYLTTIATAASRKSLTDYVSDALEASFSGVSLYKRPAVDRVYGEDSQAWPELYDPATESVERDALNLGRQADLLWSESRITRMEMLDLVASHLLTAEDKSLLDFIRSKDEYRITVGKSWKLDRTKVDAEWDAIVKAFSAKPSKAKKGAK